MSTVCVGPLPQAPAGNRWFRTHASLVFLADRRKVILAASFLIGSIAYASLSLLPPLSIALFYFLAILLSAPFLERQEIVAFALICAVLSEQTNPEPWSGGFAERLFFILIAYVGVGLLMMERERAWRLAQPATGLMAQEIARREEEIERREAVEQQLRGLVDGSPAASFTLDPQGIVLHANEAAHQLLGFDGLTLTGRSIDEYLPVLATLRQTTKVRHLVRTMIECTGRRRNAEAFLAHVWVSSFGPPSATGLTAVVFDSSQQLRENEEQGLRSLATGTRIIMGAFWHETRNLCTAMLLTAGSMKRIPGLAESEELGTLYSLIGGLEKLASAELHPESDREFETASLRAVLDHLRIVVEPWFQESGIDVTWQIAEEMLFVRGDHHGILQVFLNLARNARRALENAGRKRIAISASMEDGRILVRFWNSGPPVSDPAQLFAPFRPESAGRGIGLYVSRAIVRSCGGDLRHDAVDEGVCFTVVLETSRLAVGA